MGSQGPWGLPGEAKQGPLPWPVIRTALDIRRLSGDGMDQGHMGMWTCRGAWLIRARGQEGLWELETSLLQCRWGEDSWPWGVNMRSWPWAGCGGPGGGKDVTVSPDGASGA